MEYLDDQAKQWGQIFYGQGLALIAAVVMYKGHSFFNTRENLQELKAIHDLGVSDWRARQKKVVGGWCRQVRGVVNEYLDAVEKWQIRRLRSRSEWRELEANTLRNVAGTVGCARKKDDARAFSRNALSLSLREKEHPKIRLHRLQSAPIPPRSSNELASRKTKSAPSVLVSDHEEIIEPIIESHVEGSVKYW